MRFMERISGLGGTVNSTQAPAGCGSGPGKRNPSGPGTCLAASNHRRLALPTSWIVWRHTTPVAGRWFLTDSVPASLTILGPPNDRVATTYGLASSSLRRSLREGGDYWTIGSGPWAAVRRFPGERWWEDTVILKSLTTWVVTMTGITNRSIANKFPREARQEACRKIALSALGRADAQQRSRKGNAAHVERVWRDLGYGAAPPEYRPNVVIPMPSPGDYNIAGLELFEAFIFKMTGEHRRGPLAPPPV